MVKPAKKKVLIVDDTEDIGDVLAVFFGLRVRNNPSS